MKKRCLKKKKQKTNIRKTIKIVFDDFKDKKPVIKIKDEITDVDFDDFEDKEPVKNINYKITHVIFEDVKPQFIKEVINLT